MRGKYQRQLVGVLGDPVDDNPTVVMEQAAFDSEQIPMDYLTIQVKCGDLEAAMKGLRAMNLPESTLQCHIKEKFFSIWMKFQRVLRLWAL